MKLYKKAMDPVSFETHFIGAIVSISLLVITLMVELFKGASKTTLISAIVFLGSCVALYSASSIYHYYTGSDDNKIKLILRKLDHSMIFVLIAGTYTPLVLTYLPKINGYIFLGVIWSIALVGIIIKLCWMDAPRALSTLVYLLMGWALVFDYQAFSSVPLGCLVLIAMGGVAYSIGALIYIFKKPNFLKAFGFHELFHIFVLIGTLFHFIAIAIFIL
ncbi:MAG: hemolysin III family protein [Thomasclavelia sp.]|nr:hemolysin III family protein [Thomasclavelia sp.]